MNLAIQVLLMLISVMGIVAMLTYYERKLLAAVQLRKGPDVVGWHGLLQPIADCFKLLNKQVLWPKSVYKQLFVLAPFLTIFGTLSIFCFLPVITAEPLITNQYSLLIILGLFSMSALGECLPGLIINSEYQVLGANRAIIQILAYELCIGLCFLNIAVITGSYDVVDIIKYQCENNCLALYLPHVLGIYFLASLAQSNRTPFDNLEAEQELIAGYHTEYSSILFCVFYISEYAGILLASLLISVLFFGCGHIFELPWWIGLPFEVYINVTLILSIRAVLPRYKFYNILNLFWAVLLPILLVSALIIMCFGYPIHAL